ncbi:MAG: hypothetical protein A3J76_00485 [Candidatus Moranbacteria bacterium RBG_13_45_13]|nr:MAG: hypothetical protein A3J76_00485 [Candidatus Moranbacteria bacterium RBG_13_45_13]
MIIINHFSILLVPALPAIKERVMHGIGMVMCLGLGRIKRTIVVTMGIIATLAISIFFLAVAIFLIWGG